MSLRRISFQQGGYYHIFNKMIVPLSIFEDERFVDLFLKLMRFYRSNAHRLSFSQFKILKNEYQLEILENISKRASFNIDILTYSIMPNHYHLVVKDLCGDVISKFIADITNALTRHVNILKERKGPIFLSRFKSVPINTEEQLIHVSRYVHLNHFSAGIVPDLGHLEKFKNTSLHEYIAMSNNRIVNPDIVLSYFNDDPQRYRDFVFNHAEHQQMLERCKYVEKWSK